MNNMTWLDLFRFLNERASDLPNLGKFDWSAPVIIYDAETGDEYNCDYYYLSDNRSNKERFVLITNFGQMMRQSKGDLA